MTLSRAHRTWAAIGILCTVFGSGFTAATVVGGQVRLPARVDALEKKVGKHEARLDSVQMTMRQLLCLQLSDLEGTPWQRCLR